MATKAIIGRGLREAGAALKHSSGLEVGDNYIICCNLKTVCGEVWNISCVLMMYACADNIILNLLL